MKILNFEQGTPEWEKIRLGKFTATNGQAVATAGKGLETLCFEKASEILSGVPAKEPYTNKDLERGKELESIARANYEITQGQTVKTVGFAEMNEWVGCSPDGLVGEDGLIEIKCQNNPMFVKTKYEGKPESGYVWQMQFQMWVCEKKWCDFVVFNEHFDENIVFRIDRDETKINKIISGVEVGIAKVQAILDKIK